ncbi:hypothetical protein OUZ56_000729 [Daphnia magna]|uniref:Uncharacterized protein n=1 Tax=Daphnia magna TaxID=35525 RepID=A0ABR0A1A2_9CRUS|nr:hypothetical protein OUZ56_000729 [Daphnia magna]
MFQRRNLKVACSRDRPRLAIIVLTAPPREKTIGAESGCHFVSQGGAGKKSRLTRLPRRHLQKWRLNSNYEFSCSSLLAEEFRLLPEIRLLQGDEQQIIHKQ